MGWIFRMGKIAALDMSPALFSNERDLPNERHIAIAFQHDAVDTTWKRGDFELQSAVARDCAAKPLAAHDIHKQNGAARGAGCYS